MRRWPFALALLLVFAAGCKTVPGAAPPWDDPKKAARMAQLHRKAREMRKANAVIEGISSGDVHHLHRMMHRKMRKQFTEQKLESMSLAIRKAYGQPVGIVEEREHRENDLHWYTGLVLYEKPDPAKKGRTGALKLVLYQFAVDWAGKMHRLVVRGHPYPHEVKHPAKDYATINRFTFPSTGEWTVIQGGPTEETNKHHGHRSQNWAYDVVVKKNGHSRGGKDVNESYHAYGKPLHAPAPGLVVIARDGVKENKPGERGEKGGNGVVIYHGFGEWSELWHMIPGSVMVHPGEWVDWGDPLGKVGNSGRSTAPHIHFHVELGPPEIRPYALPAKFVDVYVDGGRRNANMPVRGQRIRAEKIPGEGDYEPPKKKKKWGRKKKRKKRGK